MFSVIKKGLQSFLKPKKKEEKMKHYLKCKKIETAINRAKKSLMQKPIYENFGQEEVREISHKFIDTSNYSSKMKYERKLLNEFDYWCTTYCG